MEVTGMETTTTQAATKVKKSQEGVLGFKELWAIGVGQVIGAGIITLIGPSIALTGPSVWLAYFCAVCLGAMTVLPIIIFSSATKYKGGDYSVITMLGGERLGGMFIIGFSLQMLGMSLFGTALGWYVSSMFPSLNGQLIGILFIILFYVVNMLGVADMANLQKLMSAILALALLMFIVVGATKADFSQTMDFTSPSFLSGGASGFWAAIMLLFYSCNGYRFNVNYGAQAKDPKRNIPWSMLAVIPVLMVLYTGVALMDASVLPLDTVVNQPLTLAAKEILPSALFYAFMFGGPIMALLTTMNSSFGAMVGPFSKASADGWLPAKVAATNKRGSAYVILTAELIIGLVPIILNLSVKTIVSNMMLINAVYQFLVYYSLFQVPKKMPKKWAAASMHVKNPVWYGILIISTLIQVVVLIYSVRSLTPGLAIFNFAVLVICFAYAAVRYKMGLTHVDKEGMVDLE